jgi:hypothetical protein
MRIEEGIGHPSTHSTGSGQEGSGQGKQGIEYVVRKERAAVRRQHWREKELKLSSINYWLMTTRFITEVPGGNPGYD